MVGESYHELITSANMIQTMADNCKSVADDLSQIRAVFRDLARDLTSNNATAKSQERGMTASQLELYGAYCHGKPDQIDLYIGLFLGSRPRRVLYHVVRVLCCESNPLRADGSHLSLISSPAPARAYATIQ